MLADCHLHFEGSLPEPVVVDLARRAGHSFGNPAELAKRRRSISGPLGFLELFADVCRLFRSPEDYRVAARCLAESLFNHKDDDGLAYAEVYVSPEIFTRIGLPAAACLEAVDAGFGEAAAGGRAADCRILLDTVRHWGREAAERVLDLYERRPLARVVGFGMGGDEASLPASEFARAYDRARALGLSTSVHAGEWQGADSVREALDALAPARVDHGIAAASDPELLSRLAGEGITLWVAPTGNVATGAVRALSEHPLPRLLEAGVAVALSADDPLLFDTTTAGEYEVARALGVSREVLDGIAARGWRAAFGLSEADREAGAAQASAPRPLSEEPPRHSREAPRRHFKKAPRPHSKK